MVAKFHMYKDSARYIREHRFENLYNYVQSMAYMYNDITQSLVVYMQYVYHSLIIYLRVQIS